MKIAHYTANGDADGGPDTGLKDHDLDLGVAPLDLWIGPEPIVTATFLSIGSANWGYVRAFQVHRTVTVTKVLYGLGVSSGNASFGIFRYDSPTLATCIATTWTFALPAAASPLSRDLTAPVELVPGVRYYGAIACDNNTATFTGNGWGGYLWDASAVAGDMHGIVGAMHPIDDNGGTFNPSTDIGADTKLLDLRFV